MSNYYYGPALDSEISYRRDSLIRDAAVHRLARQSRRARRAAARTARRLPVAAGAGSRRRSRPGRRRRPAPARDQVTRAA